MQETVEDAVQVEVWVEMPREKYAEDRKFEFEMLARALNLREVELRVALSNIFLVMMFRNSLWRNRG
jgi:hypothetical protein